MNLLEKAQEFVAPFIAPETQESGEAQEQTKSELLDQKKQIIWEYLDKNPQLLPSLVWLPLLDKETIVNAVISEGFWDWITDKMLLSALSQMASIDLSDLHQKINNASTLSDLDNLKKELNLIPSLNEEGHQNVPSETDAHFFDTNEWENSSQQSNLSESTADVASFVPSSIEDEDSLDVVSLNNKVDWFNDSKVKSQPLRKNPKTGTTLCSATTRFNGNDFWIDLPSWNAYDVATILPENNKNYIFTLPQNKKVARPNWWWIPLTLNDFNRVSDANVADIYPTSQSQYWHRALAFKNQKWKWMVLDPYIKIDGFGRTDPKPLEEYAKKRPILKAHFYLSNKYRWIA